MSEIATKVIAIVVDKLGAEEGKVTPEASFTGDLGADSLDAVELNLALEEKFGISIDEETMAGIKTVGDIVNYLEANK